MSIRLRKAIHAVLAVSRLGTRDQLIVLQQAGESLTVAPHDIEAAFERTRLRSLGVEAEVTDVEGGVVSETQLANLLGATRAEVRQLRRRRKLLVWRNRYPAWQVHCGALLPGLPQVLSVLAGRNMTPWAVMDYLLSASDELSGRRPLDLLREQRVREVLAHAGRYRVIGA